MFLVAKVQAPDSVPFSDFFVTYRRRSGVFIINFEHFLHIILVFLLLTLKK